ncbi:MAG: GNAT family N-acetyltransferase [bacterium]|nr:GNAT family N-acetyltransferase [bacterium]
MSSSTLIPIDNCIDAIKVINIRNECNEYMTNNKSKINIFQQLLWYFFIYLKENKKKNMYCYLLRNKNILGFGFIRKYSNKFWLTGGLYKKDRNKGYGKLLFEQLVNIIHLNEIWLEVLKTNIIAANLYKKLGFKKIKSKKINGQMIYIMKLLKK